MDVIFWQNILSPHQAPFLRSLADLGHEVTVVAAESMTPDRQTLGWDVPDLGGARVVVNPSLEQTKRLVKGSAREAVHCMAGARWTQLGEQAIRQCLSSGRRVGIMSEAPDPRGLLGYGRWAKYTLERYTKGFCYDFTLAMGEMGVRWFRRCGYPVQRIYPFAYVTGSPGDLPANPDKTSSHVLFVGRLVALKGVDLLFRAVAELPETRPRLRIVGTGPLEPSLRQLAARVGLQNSVVWDGHMGQARLPTAMSQADVVVLPSRKDGWGAVVNESLMAGTPVICSTACGAAELVRAPWLGSIFRSGCVEDLTKSLKHWIELGPRSQAERDRIRAWTNCITGEAVAEYFVAIVNHVYYAADRPVAPWRAISLETEPKVCTSV